MLWQIFVLSSVIGAMVSIGFCILAVSSGEYMSSLLSVVVSLSGFGLFVSALSLVRGLLSANFDRQVDEGEWEGFASWSRRRRDARAALSPARHD